MYDRILLSLGWVSAVIFVLGTFIYASQLPDYNYASQTISEIGEHGSPLYKQWQVFIIGISCMLFLFALGIVRFAKKMKFPILPFIFIVLYSISELGMGVFASPHDLHNIFGLSLILGYLTPLIFVLQWNNRLGSSFRIVSIITFVLICLGIFTNLSPIFAPSLYPVEYYGIAQRFLIFTSYAYWGFVSFKTITYVGLSKNPQKK